MKHLATWPALAGMLALGACAAQQPLKTNCPNVAVLAQGSALTEFLPGRQDVAAKIATARITGIAGSCTQQTEKKRLKVVFQTGFSALAGPANQSRSLVLPYMIVISSQDHLISATPETITLTFHGNSLSAGAASPPVKLSFPDTPETAATDVLVSFHLTPDQLAYNQSHPQQ